MSKEKFYHISFKKKKPDMLDNDKEHPKKGEGETCLTKISDFYASGKGKRDTVHKYQENSCSKMKFPKNWNNFSERCQENRKEKERVPVYLRQRGITFIRPTINSGGIVRRKNIGISKVKPPYEKNKQQHGQFRKAMQIHIQYTALLRVYLKPVITWR